MRNTFKNIFSIEKTETRDIIKCLGIKIKKKNMSRIIENNLIFNNFCLFNIMHDFQIQKRLNMNIDYKTGVIDLINSISKTPRYLLADRHACYLNTIIKTSPIEFMNIFDLDNAYICWGIRPIEQHLKTFIFAKNINKPVLFFEDSFLRSADTAANKNAPEKYRKGIKKYLFRENRE